MKKIYLLALFLMAVAPLTAFAEPTTIGSEFPTLGRGVRPLGMGNAFLTMKGTDANVLFYNPASISDFGNEIEWTTGFIPPQLDLNVKAIQLIKDVVNFKKDLNKQNTDSARIDTFNNFVNSHAGNFYGLDVTMPMIGAHNRYFAASLITDSRFDISFRNRAFPNFEIRSRNLAGVALGTALPLFDDTLSIGVSAKVLYGVENEQIITSGDILNNNFDEFKWGNWKRGLAIGADVGAKYQIPDFGQDWIDTLQPTVAVSYQNIGQTRFYFMKKNGGPTNLPQDVSAGFGIHPIIGFVETSFMFDFRELNMNEDFWLKLNFGAEARFPKRLGMRPAIRAGVHQGYPAVGAGLEAGPFIWNVAFYGMELGQYTRQKASYRIANEFSWRF